MNLGKYRSDLDNVLSILKEYSLLGDLNLHNFKNNNTNKYSKNSKSKARDNNYFDFYRTLVENADYDILLKDNSIFQFSNDSDVLRFAFYPCPDELDYNGFLENVLEVKYSEVGDTMFDLYSDYINQLSEFIVRTPIRYDFDASLYIENEHSASHIHFGFNKDFKINCDKELLPSLFVLFVIQNYYYDLWKQNKDIYNHHISNLKQNCPILENDIFSDVDKLMIYVK